MNEQDDAAVMEELDAFQESVDSFLASFWGGRGFVVPATGSEVRRLGQDLKHHADRLADMVDSFRVVES